MQDTCYNRVTLFAWVAERGKRERYEEVRYSSAMFVGRSPKQASPLSGAEWQPLPPTPLPSADREANAEDKQGTSSPTRRVVRPSHRTRATWFVAVRKVEP